MSFFSRTLCTSTKFIRLRHTFVRKLTSGPTNVWVMLWMNSSQVFLRWLSTSFFESMYVSITAGVPCHRQHQLEAKIKHRKGLNTCCVTGYTTCDQQQFTILSVAVYRRWMVQRPLNIGVNCQISAALSPTNKQLQHLAHGYGYEQTPQWLYRRKIQHGNLVTTALQVYKGMEGQCVIRVDPVTVYWGASPICLTHIGPTSCWGHGSLSTVDELIPIPTLWWRIIDTATLK